MLLPCRLKLMFLSEANNCFSEETDMRRIVPLFLSALLLVASLNTASAADKKLNVVSTIRPIQAIVLAIAEDTVDATQIIPDYASPHHYSFKPSDIRRIQKADIIFRIDEHMETLLNKSFEKLPEDKPLVALADHKNIHLLDNVTKHSHTDEKEMENAEHKDEHDEHNADADDGHEDHNNKDLHIWTSPENTLVMANIIAKKLGEMDQANTEIYQANLSIFTSKINEITLRVEKDLEPYKKSPYIVFHNSWQYFAHQFGLETPTVFDPQENISAGIKSIRKIQTEIKTKNIGCLFSDPSIKQSRVFFLIDKFKINAVEIDALGRDIPLNKNTSIEYLNYLSNKIRFCFDP